MGLFAVRRHLRKRTARKGSELSACCKVQAFRPGRTQWTVQRSLTLLHRTITLTDVLPVQESGGEGTPGGAPSRTPALWRRRVLCPAANSKVRLPYFFSTPIKAAGFRPPPYGKLWPTVSSSSDRRTVITHMVARVRHSFAVSWMWLAN